MLRARHQVARLNPLVPGPAGTRSGVLTLGSWAELVLLWDTPAGQLVALREAHTSSTGVGMLLARALSVWGEGTLLGPASTGLMQLFRPQKLGQPAPAQPLAQQALPEHPTQQKLSGIGRRLTRPSPAVKSYPPSVVPSDPSS